MSDIGVVDGFELEKGKQVYRQGLKQYNKAKRAIILNIVKVPLQNLKIALCSFYSWLWETKRKLFFLSLIIFIVYSIYTGIVAIIDHVNFWKWSKNLFIAIIIFIIGKSLLYLIHWLIGYQLILEKEIKLSEEVVNKKIPAIAKISGVTGAGKDSLMRAFGSVKRKNYINIIRKRLHTIKDTVFFIDFIKVEELVDNNIKRYSIIDQDRLIRTLAKDLKDGYTIIKRTFTNKYHQLELISDYAFFIKEPKFYISKYVIDKGLEHEHCLNLIAEYIYLYYRLNIDKHFLMTNQPSIEDKRSKLMCKMFSLDYFKLAHQSVRKKTDVYKEKVIFGLTDYLCLMESEVDSFYNNLDRQVNQELLKSGVRDAFAFNRHIFGENFSYYQVGQNASRCASLMRELTHSFITVYSKEIISGGRLRCLVLNLLNKPVTFILEFNDIFLELKKKRLKIKKDIMIPKYLLMYQATHNKKFQKKADKLKNKNYKNRKGLGKFVEKANAKINMLVEKYENDGWIKITFGVCSNSTSEAHDQVSVRQFLKLNVINGQIVTLTFRRKNTHGLYDTHYLKALKKNLEANSSLNFYNINCWDSDMVLKKEDAIITNYSVFDNFFDISSQERFDYSFELYSHEY